MHNCNFIQTFPLVFIVLFFKYIFQSITFSLRSLLKQQGFPQATGVANLNDIYISICYSHLAYSHLALS